MGPVDENRLETLVAEILGRGAVAVAETPSPPPSAFQHTTGEQNKANPFGFVGRPTSASVVGSGLALRLPGVRVSLAIFGRARSQMLARFQILVKNVGISSPLSSAGLRVSCSISGWYAPWYRCSLHRRAPCT